MIESRISPAVSGRSLRRGAAVLSLALASLGTAMARDTTDAAAKARYDKDRATCMSGKSQEDQATCLKESGAVLQERKEGKIQATTKDPAALQDNALQRCTNLPMKDRPDCEMRAKGGGVKEGSVAGGGVIKETVTTTISPRGAAVPAGSTQIGTIPGAVIPAPPSFASAPRN